MIICMLTMWQTLNICSCDHILLSGVGAVALLQAPYTEVVKCLGKKYTSANLQLCSSIQPATMLWPPHFYAPLCREPQRPFPLFPFFRLFSLTQPICFHSRNLLFRKFRKRKQTVNFRQASSSTWQWLSLLQKQ